MYNYKEQRNKIFTDEGQKDFLKLRDKVNKLLDISGAFMIENVLGVNVNTDMTLTCIDRIVELGEIIEIKRDGVFAQHRVFIRNR